MENEIPKFEDLRWHDDWVETDDPHYEDFDGDADYEPEEDYDHWHE